MRIAMGRKLTWQDVLAGRGRKHKTPRNSQVFKKFCLDCGQQAQVARRELIRAARPRCTRCGGPLGNKSELAASAGP